MPLPLQTVDDIFAKLSLAYGHRFLSIWDGFPLEDVKADWAKELDAFVDKPEAIAYGLDNLPAGRPPDVFEFRTICRRRPEPARQASLPDMAPRRIPEVLREKIAALKAPRTDGVPERERWARNYVERFGGQGQRLSFNQKQHLAAARRILELRALDDGLSEAKADAQRRSDAALAGEQSSGAAPR